MTSKSVATALTLYRARTLTLEQAATVGGCSTAQLEESAGRRSRRRRVRRLLTTDASVDDDSD